MDHQFEVGKTYRNCYGRYQVLSIDDPKMRVRYEDGREINLTIAIQVQILAGIQDAESAQSAVSKRSRRKSGSSTKKGKKRGPTKADQREKLIAEILENDEAIFEILTRLVIPPGQIDTYRFFINHPDDDFSLQQIADAIRGSDRQSLGGVFMAFGRRIGSSPDPRISLLNPRNALFFEHRRRGGDSLYRIRQRVVQIFKTYPQFFDFLINDNRSWLPDEFGSEHWDNSRAVHHAQLHFFGFWDRYQASRES
jgi:hypothetical protein